jgi:hypothetical protein
MAGYALDADAPDACKFIIAVTGLMEGLIRSTT